MKRSFKLKLPSNLSITQLIIEFVSVAFAVLLALGLNTYKEKLDGEEEARVIQQTILNEFQSNLDKVDSLLLSNEPYTQYLDSVVRLKDDNYRDFYFAYEFEILTDGAWEIALNSPATQQIDADFLSAAADIYQLQDFYMEFSHDVFNNIGIALTKKSTLKPADQALSMYYSIGTINAAALQLKEEYERFLSECNSASDS